jgi:SAM-dependent methyltransferase
MGRWSRQLAPELVTFADIGDGQTVLDIGSGTGELAFAVARAVPSSRITGVDPAAAYVKFAQSQAPSDRVRFVVGDAQRLEFADRSFDRAVSLLVMNFIPDRSKAMRELVRVTKPGGVIAAAVWDYGDGMQMLRVFWDEAVALDPSVAARDERNMPLCKRGELGEFWRAHALTAVEERPLTVQTPFKSFDDYWAPFLGGQGPAGAYVRQLGETDRAALRDRLRRRLLGDGPDGPITLQARAWAVKGVVPKR